MLDALVDFAASGSPGDLSRRIEDYAQQRRIVSALVVPWESTPDTVTMAVTSVNGDGWAIEHTNLGTIRLTAVAENRTRVAVSAAAIAHRDREKLAAVLDRFAGQLREALVSSTDTV